MYFVGQGVELAAMKNFNECVLSRLFHIMLKKITY